MAKALAVVLLTLTILGNFLPQILALKDLKCKGMPITMTDTQIANIKACAESMGVSSPEKMSMDKVGCFSKCLIEKKGLVDADGKPHKENIGKLIDSTMPEPVRADMKERTGKCLDEHGDKLDPKEESCASYTGLAMCSHKAMIEICK